MNISENGKQMIKRYEGCSFTAYKCPSGVWTIGYGHTGNVTEGDVINQAQANALFDRDIVRYEKPVQKYPNLNQNQFDALVSFCYNCGAGALEDVMSSGDITGTMAMYHHGGGGVDLPGLIRRRKEEIELYKTPVHTSSNKSDEYTVSEKKESGVFYPNDTIYFRNKPYVGKDNPIIDTYGVGESVVYDYVVVTNKYVWISWTGRTGTRRYMPVREIINGVRQQLWGRIE